MLVKKAMNKVEHILKGGLHIETNFFDRLTYQAITKKMATSKLIGTYHPKLTKYANRMQGMPCYQADFTFKKKEIINKIEALLEIKILKYHCIYRKIKTEELKESHCTGSKYGFTHTDEDPEKHIAAIMHFDQSYDGGTAFFENFWDKKPDIYISAYPNRLIIYNANRLHAPAFDYSYKERNSLAFFFQGQDASQ